MRVYLLSIIFFITRQSVWGQSSEYFNLWNDPAIQQRIKEGIEENRKGDVKIQFKDSMGNSLRKVSYEIQQQEHEFLFGANIFMLKGFEEAEENNKYEKYFRRLFNYASAPFYWKTLEPRQGQVRFDINSEKIYRRPPPDLVMNYVRQENLIVKGHTLVWEHPIHGMPDWTPRRADEVSILIDRRFKQIAERYSSSIKIWDVVNESLRLHPDFVLPKDYVFEAFELSKKYFPDAQLLINEVTSQSWESLSHVNSPYYLQIQNLICRGAKIDGIGLQFHFFSEEYHKNVIGGKAMKPADMFRSLDLLADFNKPLHITEITIPTLPSTTEGETAQAKLTENYYRLWFSHSAMQAITWWNLVDETAVSGEDKWKGGLLRRDFSEKPSFTVLNNLINREWKTSIAGKSTSGEILFRGFYGRYKINVKSGKKSVIKDIMISKNATNEFIITL